MDTWWSPAATRREARLSQHRDPPFVVADLPTCRPADLPTCRPADLPTCRLAAACSGFFAKCSALEAVAAGAVLAALASDLRPAGCTASTKAFVILDGTLLPIDRIAADWPFCSGKHEKHGMNVQIITDPAGRPIVA
jgi:hypothetical protein